MSDIAAKTPADPARDGTILVDALVALATASLVVLLAALRGFAGLVDLNGDSDSLLRLVEVRDLLDGQGWFDPTQLRMGPPGGFAMHWSRLVDAPLALLILAFGETAALVLWPAALAGSAALLLVRVARVAFGPDAIFPSAAVGALALVSIGVFQPGAIDHHNVQMVLTLGMALGLVSGGRAGGFAAGACAALTLAVGMETLPYVAAGGGIAAALVLARGEREAATAGWFGIGFALVGVLAFAATVSPTRWFAATCDAYSLAQAAVAVIAGIGLALAVATGGERRSPAYRAAALGLVALAVGALVVLAFPQCLADPYAGLDPRLKRLWLDGVVEAQSVLEIARRDPAMLFAWYATPMVGLAFLGIRAFRKGLSRADGIVGALLAVAILVSFWQVRGALFAVVLTVVPLSGWIALARRSGERQATGLRTLALAAAWILSFNAVWSAVGDRVFAPSAGGKAGATQTPGGTCTRKTDYTALAALPPMTVLAISNLGSPILAHTPHRTLAGPYHRNVAGNLAALDMFLADPASARQMALRHGVGLVLLCPGNSETGLLALTAPDGLIAALSDGAMPEWLEPVDQSGPLRLFAVRPN